MGLYPTNTIFFHVMNFLFAFSNKRGKFHHSWRLLGYCSFSLYVVFEFTHELFHSSVRNASLLCLVVISRQSSLEFFELVSIGFKNIRPRHRWIRSEYNSQIFSHKIDSKTESPSNYFWLIQNNNNSTTSLIICGFCLVNAFMAFSAFDFFFASFIACRFPEHAANFDLNQ